MERLKNGKGAGALVQEMLLVAHQGVLPGVNSMLGTTGGGVYNYIFFILFSYIDILYVCIVIVLLFELNIIKINNIYFIV
jgi:hypothetical protein